MGARTQCRVAADSRRSTDLIQTIRCRLGGAWWRLSGGGWARPDVPTRPDPGASPASRRLRLVTPIPALGFWEHSIYAGMAAGAARYSTVGFLAIYHNQI
jgi:hypothetical protein